MKKRILLIEDDNDFRENVVMMLKEENFEVVDTSKGQDGLAIAKAEQFDLILCDLILPGFDGFKILLDLSLRRDYQMPPFIIISGKSERDSIIKGIQLGAKDYILKPFTKDELIVRMQAQFAKKN